MHVEEWLRMSLFALVWEIQLLVYLGAGMEILQKPYLTPELEPFNIIYARMLQFLDLFT